MKQRILSVALALCLCISSQAVVYAGQENPSLQENVSAEEITDELAAYSNDSEVKIPTTQEAYNAMVKLKETYPEGTEWTNFTPYGRDGGEDAYQWHGGPIKGASSGVGCAAFVFLLSDAAFGNLPSRTIDNGNFNYEDVKVGDILRVNNSHFVIVMQVGVSGVIVAEGNYNKSVHWGRAMSKAEVMAANFLVTRWPVGYSEEGSTDDVTDSGEEGTLKWNLTKGGTLTISGNGVMPDYSKDNRPSWDTYSDRINTVVVESGVANIGAYAFYQSNVLIAATILSTVKTIGNNAFYNCENLNSATVYTGVETIGDEAFRGCTSLAYIDFPASITSIGAGAFMECTKMARVRFAPGDTTVSIGENLFSKCWVLTEVTLPLQADCISAGMFANCEYLNYLYIPKGIKEIKGIGELSGAPFAGSGLKIIDFGGSESEWIATKGPNILSYSGLRNTTVNYDVTFDDPFAKDPNDPGDIKFDEDENPSEPKEHQHNWSTVWSSDSVSHWHECDADNCTIVDNNQKDSYAEHSYSDWVIDTEATADQEGSKHRDCTVCAYRQTESIPINSGTGSGDTGDTGGNTGGTSGGSGRPPVINTPIATVTPTVTATPEVTATPDETGAPDTTVTPPAPDDPENPSTTVTENPDGSTTETTTSTVKTETGTTIQTTEVVNKDSSGKVTGSSTESIISTGSENGEVSVVVNVEKNAKGKVTTATANISDASSSSGQGALISGSVVKQIVETSGTDKVTVNVKKKNTTAIMNTADLTAGNKLNVVIKKSDGNYILVNAKQYTVTKDGDIFASIKGNQTYEFVNRSKMDNLSKKILRTVKVKNSSKTVKKSKTVKMALKKTLNMENVKSIQYAVSKKAVASVTKKGVVKGKKAGSAVVKATVTLKNGKSKAVRMKLKVK